MRKELKEQTQVLFEISQHVTAYECIKSLHPEDGKSEPVQPELLDLLIVLAISDDDVD